MLKFELRDLKIVYIVETVTDMVGFWLSGNVDWDDVQGWFTILKNEPSHYYPQ